MGAAPLNVALRTLLRGRGLKLSLVVTAGFAGLTYYSSQQVPASLALLFSVPAIISIMLSDSMLYESTLYALIIVGMSPKDLKVMEVTVALIISTLISTPYLLLRPAYFGLGEVLTLTSSLLVMHWFESSIKSQIAVRA